MLGRLLHVQHPTAKQAVITAIDLLGNFLYNRAASCVLELVFQLAEIFAFNLFLICTDFR